jgi:hypothetical protein
MRTVLLSLVTVVLLAAALIYPATQTAIAGSTIPPANSVPTYCQAWAAVSLGEVQECMYLPIIKLNHAP